MASLDVSFSFMMCAFACVGVCIYVWVGVGRPIGGESIHIRAVGSKRDPSGQE